MRDTIIFWAVGIAGLYLAYKVLRGQFSPKHACMSCGSKEQCIGPAIPEARKRARKRK